MEFVNKNGIKGTLKRIEHYKERFKLTLDQWKAMTEKEIEVIEGDLKLFDANCFLDNYKVNDGREKPLLAGFLKNAVET